MKARARSSSLGHGIVMVRNVMFPGPGVSWPGHASVPRCCAQGDAVTEPDGSDRFSYDVAFSFAGEDRDYVERVAKAVEGKVRLFYDRHEQTDLWGKNLY